MCFSHEGEAAYSHTICAMESAVLCPECFHIRPDLVTPPLKRLRGLGPALAGRCPVLVEAEESVGGVAGPCWCADEFHREIARSPGRGKRPPAAVKEDRHRGVINVPPTSGGYRKQGTGLRPPLRRWAIDASPAFSRESDSRAFLSPGQKFGRRLGRSEVQPRSLPVAPRRVKAGGRRPGPVRAARRLSRCRNPGAGGCRWPSPQETRCGDR